MKRKIKSIIGLFVLVLLGVSCGTSKQVYTTNQLDALHELVESNKIEIEADWAYPLPSNALNSLSNGGLFPVGSTANQVNLIGNRNYLRINGDSIKAQLPYYGERRIGGSFNSTDTGILLDGLVEDFETKYNEKKKRYEIRFSASKETENYQIAINIFPSKQIYLNVNSSQSTNIAYSGNVKSLE